MQVLLHVCRVKSAELRKNGLCVGDGELAGYILHGNRLDLVPVRDNHVALPESQSDI